MACDSVPGQQLHSVNRVSLQVLKQPLMEVVEFGLGVLCPRSQGSDKSCEKHPRGGAKYLGAESLSPLVHAETLKMHKQGGFSRSCRVSVSIDLNGNRSLGKDEGECLR